MTTTTPVNNRVKKYRMKIFMNGQTINKRTNDIEEALMSVKPFPLLTEMYVEITDRTGNKTERRLNLIQGKRLFNNDDFRKVFLINLML